MNSKNLDLDLDYNDFCIQKYVSSDPTTNLMQTGSSRIGFGPNHQSTLMKIESSGFFFIDLLECRDLNMDITPKRQKNIIDKIC
ncbi:hypothetical protein BpHYR1_043624 [Brachionus plicatilis]|uniref:Uncharacterized protein n=1 Tax=Brachionus plicatilis TaxID=10195 RepID=A0A3M7QKB8_BRAPC|nr:hypothetical protein BpHYR1_043624 [Brachionus plicatilis]